MSDREHWSRQEIVKTIINAMVEANGDVKAVPAGKAADHILAYLAPALQAQSRDDGWQDISSAPKDGTTVQLWSAEDWTPQAHYCVRKQGWYVEYWDADWQSYAESSVYEPTHWRPLPRPPEALKQLGGEA